MKHKITAVKKNPTPSLTKEIRRGGARGERGPQGERGERGPAGPMPRREDILALVEDQFADIRQQLDIQLTRFAQLQVQLDQIHKLLKQLVKEPY
jgi:hypothetical protein